MSLTVASGTVLVLGPAGSGKSTLINTFLYNMEIPPQRPTRHPRVYRYSLHTPGFRLAIVETVRVATMRGVQAVIIVPPGGEEGATYIETIVPTLREQASDLILVLVAVPAAPHPSLLMSASRLHTPLSQADFRSRASVFPFFAACLEHCRVDHTWDRRKTAMSSLSPSLRASFESSFAGEEARGRCLSLCDKQLNLEELTAMVQSLHSDAYFLAVDLSGNRINDEGAVLLATFIASGDTIIESLRLERNQITNVGGDALLGGKTAAFERFQRNWIISARGNPMSEERMLSLQTAIVDLAAKPSPRLSDSLPLILGQSPIPSVMQGDASEAVRSGELLDLIEHSSEALVLNSRDMELAAVPPDFVLMLSLKKLALGGNRIQQIAHLPQYLEALELRNNAIATIHGLETLSSLLYLDLSENRISAISGLETNFALRELSLARNLIKELTGLEHLRELRRLNVAENSLSTLLSIRTVSMNINLKALVLQGNPICQQAKYKSAVCGLLPRLVTLDGVPLSSFRTDGFGKKGEFFSVDFAEAIVESARSKATPRFPPKPLSSSGSSLLHSLRGTPESKLQSLNSSKKSITGTQKQSESPQMTVRSSSNSKKSVASSHGSSEGRRKQMSQSHSIATFPPPLPQPQRLLSVHTTFVCPEEPITSIPLTQQEKEAAIKHMRVLALFRGLSAEFFQALFDKVEKEKGTKGDVLQDGSLIVSRLLLIIRGRVLWKNLSHGAWTALFLESLISPQEAEDNVVCKEVTEFISLERNVLMRILDQFPEARDSFFRNYDNLQSAREHQILGSLDSQCSADFSKLTPSTIMRRSTPSQSAFLPKASFQHLTQPDATHTFAFSTVSGDPRSQKVQAEIQRLLEVDPFRPKLDSSALLPPTETFSDWKEAVSTMKSHISELFSYHSRELISDKETQSILAEAEKFSESGPEKTYELLALSHPDLRQCVDQAFLLPSSLSVSTITPDGLFHEYESLLAPADEDARRLVAVKEKLAAWVHDTVEETYSCIVALANVLRYGKDENLFLQRIDSDRKQDDFQVFMKNPKAYFARLCVKMDEEAKQQTADLLAAHHRLAYCKHAFERLLTAVNLKDAAGTEAIKCELVSECVLTPSLAPSKFFPKGQKPEKELNTKAELRQSCAAHADSSVSSGVSSHA